MRYNQVSTELFSLYINKKNRGIQRQRIDLSTLKKVNNKPIQSKTKTTSACEFRSFYKQSNL